jgi:hypothetical protein
MQLTPSPAFGYIFSVPEYSNHVDAFKVNNSERPNGFTVDMPATTNFPVIGQVITIHMQEGAMTAEHKQKLKILNGDRVVFYDENATTLAEVKHFLDKPPEEITISDSYRSEVKSRLKLYA